MTVPRETAAPPPDLAAAAAELFGDRLDTAMAYAEALATSGVERGLIGPREVPRLWERHLLNCVALKELVPSGVELADVGSGAGLPGLPLAIARPDLAVHLIEPLLRRVVWLREIVAQLGLQNVEIIRSRANGVAEVAREFDVVTARAVAPLPGLLELCLPLVRAGGELLAMKGDGAAQELAEAQPILERLGAVEWTVALCGEVTLATPTTVVRVVAGRRPRPTGKAASSAKPGKSSGQAAPKKARPKSSSAKQPMRPARPASSSGGIATRSASSANGSGRAATRSASSSDGAATTSTGSAASAPRPVRFSKSSAGQPGRAKPAKQPRTEKPTSAG